MLKLQPEQWSLAPQPSRQNHSVRVRKCFGVNYLKYFVATKTEDSCCAMVSLQEVIMLKISDVFRCTNVETLNSGVWLGSLPADLLTKLVHMSDEHDTTEVI